MQKLKLINLWKGSNKYRLYAYFSDTGYFSHYKIDNDIFLCLGDLKRLGYKGDFEKIPQFYTTIGICSKKENK